MSNDIVDQPVIPVARRVPRVRRGYRIDVSIGGTAFGLTINVVDGQLSEVHLDHAKHGSFGHGMTSAVAALLNEALRHGMPVDHFVRRFIGTRFEPSGLTDDPDIGWVSSPMDYLARRLAMDFPASRRFVSRR